MLICECVRLFAMCHFIRSATGVELTSAGEILLQEGESILSSVHALQKN